MEITIDQAVDLGYATLPKFKKNALQMTFGMTKFSFYNEMTPKAERGSGDCVKDYVTLRDTGNAQHIGLWQEDVSNVVNTDEEIKVDWVHASTNLEYNRIELGMNMGDDVRVYNYLNGKMMNMFREFAEELQLAMVLSPSSATDKKHPHGLASWLSLGTDDSTGDWTGYSGRYNDGSGTTYNLGGIASSSSSNARWASYYADHNGKLGDNLVNLLERACLEIDFMPPAVPKKVGDPFSWGSFRYYTNINIITNLTNLLRKSDDNIGSDLGKYAGKLVYKGIPFMYVKELNTARSTLYGTDPLYGVNHDHYKMHILSANDFVIGKPKERDNMHNVLRTTCDLSYAITCNNRQSAGFLIAQQ